MIDERTGKNIKDFPILEEPKLYVYIMLNDVGKVKISKTKNIEQRFVFVSENSNAFSSNELERVNFFKYYE